MTAAAKPTAATATPAAMAFFGLRLAAPATAPAALPAALPAAPAPFAAAPPAFFAALPAALAARFTRPAPASSAAAAAVALGVASVGVLDMALAPSLKKSERLTPASRHRFRMH